MDKLLVMVTPRILRTTNMQNISNTTKFITVCTLHQSKILWLVLFAGRSGK